METPEQQELEKFIHQQLRKLPEHEAPENLVANVFAAIVARENLPWWKQPFTYWPKTTQGLLFGVLTAAFIALVYFAWRPAESLSVSSLVERASSFAWLINFLESMAATALTLFRNLSWHWFVAMGVVFMTFYAACLATGFALYRITARPASSAA